jgi:putative membrane protein
MNKRITLRIIASMLFLGLAIGCQHAKKDDTEMAKESNDATLDESNEEKDADFLVNTAANNYAEIHLAQLAGNRSDDPEVKEIANVLESDHARTLTEVRGHASRKGIVLPSSETDMAAKDLADLIEKEDDEFDRMWREKLVDNHKQTIRNFENQLKQTKDPELKKWISSTLPTLKDHLAMLEVRESKGSM